MMLATAIGRRRRPWAWPQAPLLLRATQQIAHIGTKTAAPEAVLSSAAQTYEDVVRGVRIFHDREGHFAVPAQFQVPATGPEATTWPEDLRGFKLGMRVHKLMQAVGKKTAHSVEECATTAVAKKRSSSTQMSQATAKRLAMQEAIQRLEALGFPTSSWKDYQFQHVFLPALQAFRAIEQHMFVPQKFVVPFNDPAWPRRTWGFALGMQVKSVRQNRESISDDHADALDAIDFAWNVREAKWFQYFLPGLRTYKQIYGDVRVPLAFMVPMHDKRWPRHLWRYALGQHVFMVRSGMYSEQLEACQAELAALGFVLSVSDSLWNDTIFPALQAFVKHHGHCDVPQEFVVPAKSGWPNSAWHTKLGQYVKNIRQGRYQDQVKAHKDELTALGFVWQSHKNHHEATFQTIVLPAFETYKKLYGDVLISTDFVVPSSIKWPEKTHGFKLGQWITRVRNGKVKLTEKSRVQLEQAGFVWRVNDARWHDVLVPAFRVYAQLHGSCESMNTKFYVPSEPPYPKQAWGVNLGGALWHIRNGDTYVHDPQKRMELRKLGVLV
ncbi:TPA: hypothetical protein N0F65_000017 [Lagenidium giganteum]|uniref:Helicase-associated domain-containing protein n=1 Tax=Lagenidium giganteum TaxID=4803 RepID=A0AAV2YI90_9STRA|nr:TPA: hypothetical protein N0F65_000017 [Lagenidium giganteum]